MKLYITAPPQRQEQSQPPQAQPESEQRQQQSSQQFQQEQQPQSQPQPTPLKQQPQLLLQDIELVPYALPLQPFDVHSGPAGSSAVFPSPPLHSAIDVYAAPPLQFPPPYAVASQPLQSHDEDQIQQPYQLQSQGHYVVAMSQPIPPRLDSPGALPSSAGYGVADIPNPPSPSAPLEEGEEASSCARCGHMAHSAADRFCSACGGDIRRYA
jgi:hypothetical protein